MSKQCSVDGCPRESQSLGYCNTHYCASRRGLPMAQLSPVPRCKFNPCDQDARALGLCKTHYNQSRKGHELSVKDSSRKRTSIRTAKGWKTKKGYIIVYLPLHPNRDKRGNVPEHVIVMTEKLGRSLRAGETVHHLNGIRDDNRIENLELWATSQPSGQRVSDKIAWAKEILSIYGEDETKWL